MRGARESRLGVMSRTAERLVTLAAELRDATSKLAPDCGVPWVYNPLDHAWDAHELYVRRFATGPRHVLLCGMNPGPFGMAQTGVPFGEVAYVRDWMGIEVPVRKPDPEHPKRPIDGFACTRSEVSGARLWGLFAERYGTAKAFFREHFVTNWCPLVFMEESGRNVTPDKLTKDVRERLGELCDAHLAAQIQTLKPTFAIGVGGFARKALERVLARDEVTVQPTVGTVLHPSPASPAANRGWAEAATRAFIEQGIWEGA